MSAPNAALTQPQPSLSVREAAEAIIVYENRRHVDAEARRRWRPDRAELEAIISRVAEPQGVRARIRQLEEALRDATSLPYPRITRAEADAILAATIPATPLRVVEPQEAESFGKTVERELWLFDRGEQRLHATLAAIMTAYRAAPPAPAPQGELPPNQRCARCGYMTADPFSCPTCAARARGEADPVFAPPASARDEREGLRTRLEAQIAKAKTSAPQGFTERAHTLVPTVLLREAAAALAPAAGRCLCPAPDSWPITPDCPLHGPLVERAEPEAEAIKVLRNYPGRAAFDSEYQRWMERRSALLAAPPAPAEPTQDERVEAWQAVWDLCKSLGMDMDAEPTGLGCVLRFIRDRTPL